MREYNDRHARDGSVNAKKFYEEIIAPVMPEYKMGAWYNFLARFKTAAGLVIQQAKIIEAHDANPGISAKVEENKLSTALLSNEAATQLGIKTALNIGAKSLQDLMENLHLTPPKDRVDILFKAMKAQDSRIHAIGKIREDNREEEKFNRAFDGANY